MSVFRLRYPIIGLIILLILVFLGSQFVLLPIHRSSFVATDVVTEYYALGTLGKKNDTYKLMAPYVVSKMKASVQENRNLVLFCHVSGPYKIRADSNFKHEVQVVANYYSLNSGFGMRFIYLGRNNSNDSWKIISIGTGP